MNIVQKGFVLGTSFVTATSVVIVATVTTTVRNVITIPRNIVRGTKELATTMQAHINQATKE